MRYTTRFWVTVLALLLPAVAGAEAPAPPAPAGQERGWLGVWLGDSIDGGIEVVAVVPGGPAHQSGVRVGDVLLQAEEIDLTEQGKLRGILTATAPGESIRLVVLRGGRPLETVVTTGLRLVAPSAPAAPSAPRAVAGRFPRPFAGVESIVSTGVLGVRLTDVTPQLREHYGAPADSGVLVTGVDAGKLAAVAGIEVGDVLVSLDDRRVVRADQLESALLTWNGIRPLKATVVRRREVNELVLVAALRTSSADSAVLGEFDAARARWQESQREAERKRLELEIRQLERRLENLRHRLERVGGG